MGIAMKKLKVTIEAQEAKTIYVPILEDGENTYGDYIEKDEIYCEDEYGQEVEDEEEVWSRGANILLDNIKWNAEIVEE